MRTIIYTIVALVLLAIGAAGGYFYGVTVGQTQANTIRQQFLTDRGLTPGGAGGAAATAGGQGAGGAAGFGGQGGQGTFGSVRSVSGNTLEVAAPNGSLVKVTLTDQTTVQQTVQQTAAVSDLQPGTQVVIQGERDSQGNVTARSINVVPAGAGGAAGAAGRREGTPGAGGQGGGQGGAGGRRQGGTPQAGGTPTP